MGIVLHSHLMKWENVKLPTWVVDEVREHKKKTGVPISFFFTELAIKKLGLPEPQKEKSKKKK